MENNSYSLKIQIINAEGGDSPVANTKAESKEPKTTPEMKLASLVAHKMSSTFLNTSKQIIMNNVHTNLGNSEIEQRINFGMNMVQKGVSTITGGLALSATLGVTGPIGIGIAATLGIIDFAANTIVRQNEINNNARVENEQLQVLRGRMGVQFNRSRTGE